MGLRGSSATRASDDPGTRVDAIEGRRLLVQRIASSTVVSKSARLRDLLLYLCDRVLEGKVDQIHEQEVGHHVFGRPPDYDTTIDNIVRVHASQLRKRLAEYFSNEGARESLVIEIPRGNYAPVFRERVVDPPGPSDGRLGSSWMLSPPVVGAIATTALFFACSTAWLLIRTRARESSANADLAARPMLHLLWSQVIRPDRPTDIVLDDASLGLYQELTKRRVPLNDYFDRSYLLKLSETAAAASIDRSTAASVITRRHASNAAVAPLWKLFQVSQIEHGHPSVQFARDYSFRGLKTNDVILLGSSQSNPWVEPFENRLGLRWAYDNDSDSPYPVDTWSDLSSGIFRPSAASAVVREGYCAVSLLSNLGASGNVLLISATGGSTIATCAEFLTDEQALAGLYKKLGAANGPFPQFEALLRMTGRSTQPRAIAILISRSPRT